jgi:surface antigen
MVNRFWIVGIAVALLPMPSFGQIGWGRITQGGPFQEFRDGDWEMFRQSVVRAADSPEAGNPITWTNAKTGAQGTVRVAKRYTSTELGECRDLQGNTSARSRTGPFAVTLCRQPGGIWRIN